MSEGFIDQFIRDYYIEADEHLAILRRVLLQMESNVGEQAIDDRALADLFRALHTLKGLSGMVGFIEVEQLAHALEDWFRNSLNQSPVPTTGLVTIGFEGVRLLESCLGAHQQGRGCPDVVAFAARIGGAKPAAAVAAASTRSADQQRVDDALRAGETVHEFIFTPSAARAAAGVTVERVRETLAGHGDLLSATPRVQPGGVEFRFAVVLHEGVELESIELEGVTSSILTLPAPSRPADVPAAAAEPTAMVRVDLNRLDDLMRHVGELVISRSRLDDALRSAAMENAAAAWSVIQETNLAMERQLRALRESVMRVRLVNIGEVFERLRFVAREVARDSGKQLEIEMFGESTEIDKLVVDRMLEPLMHIVRNAVSHGLESEEQRLAHGKPAQGKLTFRASAVGDRVRIEVQDDGAGIDLDRVTRRARSAGLIAENDAVTSDGLLDVISAQGFSTRETADLASGRGVGMAVVRTTVKQLGGELHLSTTPGAGTCFRIELPLTLMIVEALLTRVGAQLMAVPMPSVREILQVDPGSVTRFENNEVMSYRGGVLPLLRLPTLFGLSSEAARFLYVLVVGTESEPIGLITDKIVGAREIVVRPIDDPLVAAPGISGATELSDGRLVLILDTSALARLGRQARGGNLKRVRAIAPHAGDRS